MDIYNVQKHLSCYCYDTKDNTLPLVEVKRYKYAEAVETSLLNSGIIYVFSGKLQLDLRDNPGGCARKREFVFMPASDKVRCKAVTKSSVLILRMPGGMRMCHSFGIEYLVNKMNEVPRPESLHPLKANARLQYFFRGLADTWADGFKCRIYLQAEVSKLLTMIRVYYSDEELCRFFYAVLSPDTAFSEYVRMHHLKYPTVGKLAGATNMSTQQFRRRFTAIFGQPPYGWMRQEKARLIYGEICMTDKPLKKISGDFGFSDKSHFNRFCNSAFGMGPKMIRQNRKVSGTDDMDAGKHCC